MKRLVVLLFLFSFAAHADDAPWKVFHWQDGLLMLSRPHPNLPQQQELLAVLDSPAPPGSMLNLMLDYRSVTKWMSYSEEAQVLAQPAGNHYQMQTLFDAPWPMLGRNVTTESHHWQEASAWWLEVIARPELNQRSNDYLVVHRVQTCWAAMPSGTGSRIFYMGYLVDPGKTPGFIVKQASRAALQQSLIAFRRWSSKAEYLAQPVTTNDGQRLRGWGYCSQLKAAVRDPRIIRLLQAG